MSLEEILKLTVNSIHNKKQAPLDHITRDGWVVTDSGAFGDHEQDCTIQLDMTEYLKKFRKDRRLSQQEMAWILGISRPTYSAIENGTSRQLTLKEYLILQKVNSIHI